jgi:uncharacterized protein (TIGR02266 family)
MPSTPNRQASIKSRRIDLEREIAIRVPRFETFVTEYSANLSTTGMFIVSTKPLPPATTFHFEFSVADDWKLIRGTARVVWTRYKQEGPERPPGMGVKFLELDAESRRLIRWIVEKHVREGGRPFELDEVKTEVDEALEQVFEASELSESETTRPQADPSESGRMPKTTGGVSSRSRVVPLILTAGVIFAAACLLFWLSDRIPDSTSSEVEAPAEESSAPGRSTSVETPQGPSDEPSEQVPSGSSSPGVSPPEALYSGAAEAVSSWADAWSTKDVASHLAAYSRDFTPDDSLSRDQWTARRREQILGSEYINVSISGLELERLSTGSVRVTFNESYRSDRRDEIVRKTMELVWEDGVWKILRESPS